MKNYQYKMMMPYFTDPVELAEYDSFEQGLVKIQNNLFAKKGVISYAAGLEEDVVLEVALESGADDIETAEDGAIDVFTEPNEFGSVKDALDAAGFGASHAEVTLLPSTKALLDVESAPKLLRLIDALEDLDDVQEVYHNGDISQEVADSL